MIRQVEKNNHQLVQLSEACFSELRAIYSPNQLAKKNKSTASNDWVSFGYFISEKLIACVDVKYTDGELNFSSLAVNKKYRRQGLARKLIVGVIALFKDAHRASLWCVKQTGNVDVFEAMNFKVVQEVKSALFEMTKGGCAIEVQLTLQLNR